MDWTGILVGAAVGGVTLFIWSAICWMVLPFHKKDFRKLPNPEPVEQGLAAAGLEPGLYCVPHQDQFEKGMKDPALSERMAAGPNAMITVLPKGPPMTPATFGRGFAINFLSAAALALFLAWRPGAVEGLGPTVYFCAGAGLFSVVTAHFTMSNWMGVPWRFSFLNLFDDGVGFALVGVAMHFLGPSSGTPAG